MIENDNRVWASVERSISSLSSPYLSQYESVKISTGESRSVGPDEDPEEIRDELTQRCLDKIDEVTKEWQK